MLKLGYVLARSVRDLNLWPMKFAGALLAVTQLAGCGTLGSIEHRAETINKLTAAYSASAIFYNILRAKNGEPLNFVSLTGVTGHDTANFSLGLPTIVVGPHVHTSPHFFSFGPNQIQASESDDFIVNRIDDPASYAALSRPTDPATIGYFMNQLFVNRDQIFFLFVSKIRRVNSSNKVIGEYYNEPYVFDQDKGRYGLYEDFITGFVDKMVYYLDRGLVVDVDQTYVPGSKTSEAKFCFEPRPDVPLREQGPNTCPVVTPTQAGSHGAA